METRYRPLHQLVAVDLLEVVPDFGVSTWLPLAMPRRLQCSPRSLRRKPKRHAEVSLEDRSRRARRCLLPDPSPSGFPAGCLHLPSGVPAKDRLPRYCCLTRATLRKVAMRLTGSDECCRATPAEPRFPSTAPASSSVTRKCGRTAVERRPGASGHAHSRRGGAHVSATSRVETVMDRGFARNPCASLFSGVLEAGPFPPTAVLLRRPAVRAPRLPLRALDFASAYKNALPRRGGAEGPLSARSCSRATPIPGRPLARRTVPLGCAFAGSGGSASRVSLSRLQDHIDGCGPELASPKGLLTPCSREGSPRQPRRPIPAYDLNGRNLTRWRANDARYSVGSTAASRRQDAPPAEPTRRRARSRQADQAARSRMRIDPTRIVPPCNGFTG